MGKKRKRAVRAVALAPRSLCSDRELLPKKRAKAIAFDMLFTEPSAYGVEDDAAFAHAISEFGHTAIPIFIGQKITLPIPEISKSATVLCNVRQNPDPDGIYRKIKIFDRLDQSVLLSLGLGTFAASVGHADIQVAPAKAFINQNPIPIDQNQNAILRFRGPAGTHRTYSAAAVIQSEIRIRNGDPPTIQDPDAFKDKYVLFGSSAPGLYDLRSTPVGGVYPGVEIHATLLDNFLSGDFIEHIPVWTTVISVILLSVTGAGAILFLTHPFQSILISVLWIAIPITLSIWAYTKGLWMPLAVQEATVAFTMTMGLLANYSTEGRQKRFIKNAFKQYLSPAVIEQLIQHPERLKLGGERRMLSIFFSDLQGFTSISEGLDPEVLTELLNEYLSAMTDIIHEEGGTVDKYEGDAIIAFWNAPIEIPDHEVRIVRAALRCQAKLDQMQPGFRSKIGKELRMRIGVNTGLAVVGNMGSHTRFDYTMIGDSVNLASRLEGINKQFGIYTLISQFTAEKLNNQFALREIARVAVVGKKEAITVFEPMELKAYDQKAAVLDKFSQGLQWFYQGRFPQAQAVFSEVKDADPASAAYEKKCSELVALYGDARPENWNGVWVMTSK